LQSFGGVYHQLAYWGDWCHTEMTVLAWPVLVYLSWRIMHHGVSIDIEHNQQMEALKDHQHSGVVYLVYVL
jgi:hypothetical protein